MITLAMAYDVETMVNRHIVSNLGARLLSELTMEDVGYLTGVLRQCPYAGRRWGLNG